MARITLKINFTLNGQTLAQCFIMDILVIPFWPSTF